MRFLSKLLLVTIFAMSLLSGSIKSFAEESGGKVLKSESLVKVTPIYMKEQISKDNAYHNLKVSNGKKYTLKYKVENTTKENLNLFISVNDLVTSSNIELNYRDAEVIEDYMLDEKYRLSNYVEVQNKLSLKAEESKVVEAELDLKETDLNGLLVGGLHIATDKSQSLSDNGEIEVKMKVDLVSPIKLELSNEDVDTSKITNGDMYIENGNFYALLSNKNSNFVKGEDLEVKLESLDGSKTFLYVERDKLTMAPMSSVKYSSILSDDVSSGTYKATISFKVGDEHVNLSKDIEIKGKELAPLKSDTDREKENNDNLMVTVALISGVVILILVVFIIILLLRLKKKKEEDEKLNN